MAKLTEKQDKFAMLVGAKGIAPSKAYPQAYDAENMSEKTIFEKACVLARQDKVKARIEELKKARTDVVISEISFDVRKLMETYLAIAFVDPNELISQRAGACRHCHGEGGGYHWKAHEYEAAVARWERAGPDPKTGELPPMPDIAGGFGYRFTADPNPDCGHCEGEGLPRIVPKDTTKLSAGAKLLYQGVQQTKDGVKVLFASKDKALDQIGRILGAYDDKLRLDLQAKVTTLQLTTSDPKEAAEAYARMLSGS